MTRSLELGAIHRAPRGADSYGLVLTLLTISFILSAIPLKTHWLHLVKLVLLGGTLVFALRTSLVRPHILRLALLLFLASIVLSAGVATAESGKRAELGTIAILDAMLLALVPPAVLRRILKHPRVDLETVLGAIAVYVTLGLFFQSVFYALNILGPPGFFQGHLRASPGACQFFSFATLTTVGYGNIVPATSLGQSLAILEALTGQIYLVTLVARLVSVFGLAPDPDGRSARNDAAGFANDGDG